MSTPNFPCFMLKEGYRRQDPSSNYIARIDEEGKIILEHEAITDTRIRQLMNKSISEYLIKLRKLPAKDSTWEDDSFIQKHP